MTQGPGDLIIVPAGFVVAERVLNNADAIGLKMTTVIRKAAHGTAELFMCFGDPEEAMPKAFLTLLHKIGGDDEKPEVRASADEDKADTATAAETAKKEDTSTGPHPRGASGPPDHLDGMYQ